MKIRHSKYSKPNNTGYKLYKVFRSFSGIAVTCVITYFLTQFLTLTFTNNPSLSAPLIFSHSPISVRDSTFEENVFEFTVPTEKVTTIQCYFSNNDTQPIIINSIYINVIDYKEITELTCIPKPGMGGYSDPIYYFAKIGKECKKYTCTLLDKSKLTQIETTSHLLEASASKQYEKVPGKDVEQLDILFFATYPGIYTVKIEIGYSIRNKSKVITSEASRFVALGQDTIDFYNNQIK